MSTISLCVVARDAAPNLPDCIRSAEGLVDEVVVLDSGKLNGAGEWASVNGAKMIPYQWTGDLSEARTVAARKASSDWVLMMDADEVLGEGAATVIRDAVNCGGMDCGYLPLIRQSSVSRDAERDEKPRLMRRTMDLHWDTDDSESVGAWIAMRARRVRILDAPIVKTEDGVHGASKPTEPAAVDHTVLETPNGEVFVAPEADVFCAEAAVDSASTATGLDAAWAAYHNNDLEACSATVDRLLREANGDSPELIQLVTLRAHLCILKTEFREALDAIGAALALGVHHPNFDMLQGVVAEHTAMQSVDDGHRRECLDRAAAAFKACIAYDGEISAVDSLPGVTSWAAYTRLGSARLASGDLVGARDAFEAALQADPEHAEATLGLLECRLESGDGAAIIEPLLPFMESNIADAWMLAASACEEMGRLDDALLFTQRAHELQENGLQVSAHRDFRLAELIAMAGLYVGRPLVGPGAWGAIGAIVAREPVSEVALPGRVDEAKATRFVNHCVSAGWSDVLESMLEPRADQVAPGIGAVVRQALEALGATAETQDVRAPVFLGGTWDSGVRTLQGMIDRHSSLEAGEETKLIPLICSLRNEWWNGMAPDLEAAGIGEPQLNGAVKAFIETLLSGATASTRLRSVETTPHTLLHMESLATIFPRARFVHVVRDGRDVVGSLLQRDWMDPTTGEKVWCCQSPKAAAEYWVHVVDAIREQGARLPGRYLEVSYEDLIAQPEASMRRVLAFLGETWEPAVLDRVIAEPEVRPGNEAAIVAAIENTPRCAPPESVGMEQPSHAK
ncbi:MAG: sulfotransferase [Myxococcota bacterium]|nr:sulfotransferase [Myxococcota bacterium]